MKLKFIFVVLISFFIQACSHNRVKPTLIIDNAVPIYATFNTQSKFGKERRNLEWQFKRSQHRIEVYVPSTNTGEIWLKDKNHFFYQKVFHQHKKLIEYTPEDFRAFSKPGSSSPSWDEQALLISPEILNKLTIKKEKNISGELLMILEGEVNQVHYQVDWSNRYGVPFTLIKQDKNGHYEKTSLSNLTPTQSLLDSTDYEIIDYADLGDRERDAFVQKIQHQLPGHFHQD